MVSTSKHTFNHSLGRHTRIRTHNINAHTAIPHEVLWISTLVSEYNHNVLILAISSLVGGAITTVHPFTAGIHILPDGSWSNIAFLCTGSILSH